jgi:hypothetical protein
MNLEYSLIKEKKKRYQSMFSDLKISSVTVLKETFLSFLKMTLSAPSSVKS